jgi:hypothetical protein
MVFEINFSRYNFKINFRVFERIMDPIFIAKKLKFGSFITAMANPRPLKLLNVALLQTLKNTILEQNRLDL